MPASLLRRLFLLPALALVGLTAGTFLQGYAVSGHKWGTSTVRYYVNPRNNYVSDAAAVSAIQTAAAVWSEQSRANVALLYAGTTSGSSLLLNSKNEVFFRDTASGVGESYWWWDGTGSLVDADIVLNQSYRFFVGSGCENGVYIENVTTHEFGHVLGLLHSSLSGVTMQPAMQSYCDRTQLTLESDDIAGIEFLYGPVSGGTSNTAPAVAISAPANNTSLAEGTTMAFSGSATDTQDGTLTASLRWTSNLAGQIGTGGSFSRTLPVGVHLITAAVTDSGGLSASRQVTVTVTGPASAPAPVPSGPTLTVRGYKVKGRQRAELGWGGLTSSSADIYRDGTKLQTVPNNGAYTDSLNQRGGGSYTYKVCEGGTSVCSNSATVVF